MLSEPSSQTTQVVEADSLRSHDKDTFNGICEKMTTGPYASFGAALDGGKTVAEKLVMVTQHRPQLNIPAFRRPLGVDPFQRPLRRHSQKSRTKLKKAAKCVVCGERASGMYFGALVCLPCKSFFIRCTKDGKPQLTCLGEKNCNIDRSNRMRCQYCRYKKCLTSGMMRREKPECVEPGEGQELCRVCADIANGIHFGVMTCEGCKKFFRRALKEADTYDCKHQQICTLNPRNRNACRYCRYRKCISVGMSRQAIRMGRPKKVKTENEGLYTGYGGSIDCFYAQTPSMRFGTMAPPQGRPFPSVLTMPQQHPFRSPAQNSCCPPFSGSDDSGIESDMATSPPASAHSPPLSAMTIKSEPKDFFGASSCHNSQMCYESKEVIADNSLHHLKSVPTRRDVDIKNGTVDLEDFFLTEPAELDTEDMNDVLTTLGQFLGSLGQTAASSGNVANSTTTFGQSDLYTGIMPQLTDKFAPKFPQPASQHSFTKPATYQDNISMQNTFQSDFRADMFAYSCNKQWQSSQQCSQPYYFEQSSAAVSQCHERQGSFPCFTS